MWSSTKRLDNSLAPGLLVLTGRPSRERYFHSQLLLAKYCTFIELRPLIAIYFKLLLKLGKNHPMRGAFSTRPIQFAGLFWFNFKRMNLASCHSREWR